MCTTGPVLSANARAKVSPRLALGFGPRGDFLRRLERGRTEDLYAAGVSPRGRSQPIEVRRPLRVGLVGRRLASLPVESLAASWRLQRED